MDQAAKHVRRLFAQIIAERVPQFEPQGGVGKVAMPGWRSFLWKVAEDLHFFVCLCLDESKGEFAVEGAWSDTANYPMESALGVASLPARWSQLKEAVLRLDQRWPFAAGADEAALHTALVEAVAAIEADLIPLFVKRAGKKGIRLG